MEDARQAVLEMSRYGESGAEIAKQYADYARKSRIMARIMAEADCSALASEEN